MKYRSSEQMKQNIHNFTCALAGSSNWDVNTMNDDERAIKLTIVIGITAVAVVIKY